MADVKLNEGKGFPQVELNQVAFRRDGRIEAQCKLDATDFATDYAFNGTILAIDNTNRTVKYPSADAYMFGLNYSTEHLYDERYLSLRDFALKRGSFLPRLGYLAKGDKFTTNAIIYDSALTLAAGQVGYITASDKGYIRVAAELPDEGVLEAAPQFKVIAVTTMPDGNPGLKVQVIKD